VNGAEFFIDANKFDCKLRAQIGKSPNLDMERAYGTKPYAPQMSYHFGQELSDI
jgi:hypothetical protein